MNPKKQKKHAQRQQNLHDRLAHKNFTASKKPLLDALPIHYGLSERTRVLVYGGLGAIHTLVTKLKLPQAINKHVKVFKRHLPYFESDHVLSLCYNMLTGGKTLEEVNRLRRDYLDALSLGCRPLRPLAIFCAALTRRRCSSSSRQSTPCA